MSVSAHAVADYLLTLQDDESGELISNLKLQKLLYYAQGYHLALFDKPLFDEQILAWKHGPVVRSIWEKYRDFESRAIPRPDRYDPRALKKETKEFLNEVYQVVGQFSAWKLRNMTHEEAPWKDTRQGGVITRKAMKTYFKTLMN